VVEGLGGMSGGLCCQGGMVQPEGAQAVGRLAQGGDLGGREDIRDEREAVFADGAGHVAHLVQGELLLAVSEGLFLCRHG